MSTLSVRSRLHRRSELPCAALMLIFSAAADAQSQQLSGLPDLIERVAPSVVTISGVGDDANVAKAAPKQETPAEHGAKDPKEANRVQGAAGMVVSADGYIVTAGHVVDGMREISVTLEDSTRLPAKLIGLDKRTNIGLLKVEPQKPLEVVHFADSSKVRRGEPVIAIGNPYGLDGSVSLGIISATKRDIGAGPYDYFQTDAAINKGSSGAPLFDFNGGVVAMASAIYSPTGGNVGIGFAIPSNLVQKTAQELKQSGSVARGWLGVKLQNVDADTAASIGLQSAKGALITEIPEGGPAASAGLKSGDAVLEVNGNEISDGRVLARIIADQKPDTTIDIVIWRDREKKTIPVHLGWFPGDAQAALAGKAGALEKDRPAAADTAGMAGNARFPGLKVATSDKDELVITAVDAGSDAAAKNLQKGDIILEAGGIATKAPKDLTDAIAKSRARGAILLRIKSGDAISYRSIRLGSAPSGESTAPAGGEDRDKLQ